MFLEFRTVQNVRYRYPTPYLKELGAMFRMHMDPHKICVLDSDPGFKFLNKCTNFLVFFSNITACNLPFYYKDDKMSIYS